MQTGDKMSDEIQIQKVEPVDIDDYKDSSIQLLKPIHQRFVHMYLSGTYKLPQISEVLGVSIPTLRRWLRDERMQSVIADYQKDEADIVQQTLKSLSLKALYKMNDLLDSDVDGIAYQAARDILDRTGHKPSQKQDVKIEVYNYEKQIQQIVGNDERFIEGNYTVEDDEENTDINK